MSEKIMKTLNGYTVYDETARKAIKELKDADGGIPSASVEQTDTGAVITITDKDGTTTAMITNGKDGQPGETGDPGEPGEAGTSVTVASVSESAEDGGSNVVMFSDGTTLNVKNGKTGAAGATGANGKDGSDANVTRENIAAALGYTPADADVVTELSDKIDAVEGELINMSQAEAPQIVASVDEMTDTTKHYVNQETGTIWAYMKHTKSTPASSVPNFNNVFDADTAMIGYRWSGSTGAPSNDTAANILSDFIHCDLSEGEHTLRMKNGYVHQTSNINTSIVYFSSNDNDSGIQMVKYSEITAIEESDGVYAYKLGDKSGSMFSGYQNTRYIRVCFRQGATAATLDDARNVIITIDEPITYTDVPESTETYYAWTDTGISYAPTYKTDLIGVLGEDNVIYLSSDKLPSGTYTLKDSDNDFAVIGTYTV